MTRLIERKGIAVGFMGGNIDWKIVVVRLSRCLGIFFLLAVSSLSAFCELKLFMTSSGEERYSFPPLLGLFMLLWISLHKLYFSTLKHSVGPRGVTANRSCTLPFSLRLKSMRCETPSGPAMEV